MFFAKKNSPFFLLVFFIWQGGRDLNPLRPGICFNFAINFYQPIIKLTAKAVYALREAGFEPGFPAGGKAEPSVWSPARNSHAAKSRSVIRQPEATVFFQLHDASKRRGGANAQRSGN